MKCQVRGIRKIYYINLDRSPKRNESIRLMTAAHFKKIPTERVEAVDGSTVNFEQYRKLFTQYCWSYRGKMPGAFACYLSHIKIFKKIASDETIDPNDVLMVLEDDAKFDPTKINLLNQAVEALSGNATHFKNCHWLALGLRRKRMHHKLKSNHLFSIPVAKDPFNVGTHAYLIRKSSVPTLLKIHLPFKYHHIDIRNRHNYKPLGFLCTTFNVFTVIGDGSIRRKIDADGLSNTRKQSRKTRKTRKTQNAKRKTCAKRAKLASSRKKEERKLN